MFGLQRIRKKRKINPEAERALQESRVSLHRIKARSEEVHEVAEASRRFRRENHFRTDLEKAFGG